MREFEKVIKLKAERRFEDLLKNTREFLKNNELLSDLKIFVDKKENKYFKLIGRYGYCPATDLFSDEELRIENTNYEEIKSSIIQKFEKEEIKIFEDKFALMKEYFMEDTNGTV